MKKINSKNVVKWAYSKITANCFWNDCIEKRLCWPKKISEQLLIDNPGKSVEEISKNMANFWDNFSNNIALSDEEMDFLDEHFDGLSYLVETHASYSPLRYNFSDSDEDNILKSFMS